MCLREKEGCVVGWVAWSEERSPLGVRIELVLAFIEGILSQGSLTCACRYDRLKSLLHTLQVVNVDEFNPLSVVAGVS